MCTVEPLLSDHPKCQAHVVDYEKSTTVGQKMSHLQEVVPVT